MGLVEKVETTVMGLNRLRQLRHRDYAASNRKLCPMPRALGEVS